MMEPGYKDDARKLKKWLQNQENIEIYKDVDTCIEDALKTGRHSAIACFLLAHTFSNRMRFYKLLLEYIDSYLKQSGLNSSRDNLKDFMNGLVIWEKQFLLDPYYIPIITETPNQNTLEDQIDKQRLKWIVDQPETPKRESIIQIALQLHIGLEGANQLLMAAGKNTLYLMNPLDICAIYYLEIYKEKKISNTELMSLFKKDLNQLILDCKSSWTIVKGGYRKKSIKDKSELTDAEANVLKNILGVNMLEDTPKHLQHNLSCHVRDDKGQLISFTISNVPMKNAVAIKIASSSYQHHLLWDPTVKKNRWKKMIPYHFQIKNNRLSDDNDEEIQDFIELVKESEEEFSAGTTDFITLFFKNKMEQSPVDYFDAIFENINIIGNRRFGFLRKTQQYLEDVSRYKKNTICYPYYYQYRNGGFVHLPELFNANMDDDLFHMDSQSLFHDEYYANRIAKKIHLLSTIMNITPVYEEELVSYEMRRADRYSSIGRILYGREFYPVEDDDPRGYYQDMPPKSDLIRYACAAGAEDELGSYLQYAGYWDRDYFNEKDLNQFKTLDWLDYMIIYMRRYRDRLLESWALRKNQSVLIYSNEYRKQFPFYLLICEVTKQIQILSDCCRGCASKNYLTNYNELPKYFICKTIDLDKIKDTYRYAMVKLLMSDRDHMEK